jgi:hypothetical protein
VTPFLFEPSSDATLIKAVMRQKQIYEALHDDDAPEPEKWEVPFHPQVGFVAIWRDSRLYGIAMVIGLSRWEAEVHNALLPHVGWKTRLQIVREFFAWCGHNGFKRVIGKVPGPNRYAIAFNKAAGMELIGVDRASFMQRGELVDQTWFGISL